MRWLASPTEPDLMVSALDAIRSPLCESKGVDYLLYSRHGTYGAQRKEAPYDFLSSFWDGRLTKETTLMQELDFREVIAEGMFSYDRYNNLLMDRHVPRTYTRKSVEKLKLNISFVKGIPLIETLNQQRTIDYLKIVGEFLSEEKHMTLFRTPKIKGVWGVRSMDELRLGILQAFPDVGPSLADKILTHFGGRLPMCWDCHFKDLMSIRLIGHARAKKIWEVLE